MPEVYAWPEGSITLWTGHAVPISSAVVAYAENVSISHNYGWENVPTLSRYDDYSTGQACSLSLGAMYTKDNYLQRLADSKTAVHIKALHSGVNGTAGVILYSGRIDSVSLVGSEGQVFRFSMNYHSNRWSAF